MRRASNGKTLVDRGPGVCGFDCFFCGCDCKCVFMEHNWQKITAGIVRDTLWLEGQVNAAKNGDSNPSPEGTERSAWTQYIMTGIDNWKVREDQQVDGRSPSPHELLHDMATLAALNANLNPVMAAGANISCGLWNVIPLTASVKYCAEVDQ